MTTSPTDPVAEQVSGDHPCPEDCTRCSGEYCEIHGVNPCECEHLERHGIVVTEPAPLPQAAVEGTLEPSVVFRESPLTDRDYDEAIEYLQEAKRLGITGCPCGDSGHSAEQCHHNPLVQARRGVAKDKEFRCFHCGEIFDEETGREHFGEDESAEPACLKAATQSPEPSALAQIQELIAPEEATLTLAGIMERIRELMRKSQQNEEAIDRKYVREDFAPEPSAGGTLTIMQEMHDDLERCLQEGKSPVLLLVVWRNAIANAKEQPTPTRPPVETEAKRPIGNRFHCHGDIIKNSNGEKLPVDEPLFLIRARDHLAIIMLERYRKAMVEDGCNDYIMSLMDEIIGEFVKFKAANPDKMKQPGITRGL